MRASSSGRRLRVGIVDYLNSRPLAWGFLQGRWREGLEASYHPPAQVADRLRRGELDVGLVPSIELQRIPGLEVLPGLCVAATHEVRSVLLLVTRPPEAIRRVALDENSRTSAALVRILLKDRYGVEVEAVARPPELESMLAGADAALIIGDPALQVGREGYRVLDLAAEWRALTGLPFVFAVWAARPGVLKPATELVFQESLAAGRAAMEEIVRDAAASLDLPEATVREYLTRHLSYDLAEEELAGLEEFFRRAAAHGLIQEARPLRLRRTSLPPIAR